jgi:hypothetical protein
MFAPVQQVIMPTNAATARYGQALMAQNHSVVALAKFEEAEK